MGISMIIVQNDNKYPLDGIRVDWDEAIKEVEEALNKTSNKGLSDMELISMIMEIKKLNKIDDIEGYFTFLINHKEEYDIIHSL